MRVRATFVAALMIVVVGFVMASAGSVARAQTPVATATVAPFAPCPTGSLTVAPPTAAAPNSVTVTITPPLANLKAATAADPNSHHVHYFVDTPAAPAGAVVPTNVPSIIHSASLTQDLGALAPGSHTVVVVVGQIDHRACDLRGQVTFTTSAQTAPTAAVSPPKTGSGGFLGQAAEATASGLAMSALAIATAIAVGGAAIATRRR